MRVTVTRVAKTRNSHLNMVWSDGSVLILIAEVQQRECLWNALIPEFKNPDLKEKAWDEVVEVLGVPFVEVFKKWNSLCRLYPAMHFLNPPLGTERDPASGRSIPVNNKRPRIATQTSTAAASQSQQQTRSEEVPVPVPVPVPVTLPPLLPHPLMRQATTMPQVAQAEDYWDVMGSFVNMNGSQWEAKHPHIGRAFRAQLYKLVYDFQIKVNELEMA